MECPEQAHPQRQDVGSWLSGAEEELGGWMTADGTRASFRVVRLFWHQMEVVIVGR